ncbi:MAG: hypothetical protein U0Q16_23175 [Bryobacteraceae bacterium]
MHNTIRIAAGIAIIASLSNAGGAQEEVWVGVWKLSHDKSPKAPNRPKSQIITMKSENGQALFDEENVLASSDSYRVSWRLGFDGKDYPVSGSRAGIDLIQGQRLGPDTVEIKVKKKDGTVLGTYWVTHSADGKTRITLQWGGQNISGPPARVTVHERQ